MGRNDAGRCRGWGKSMGESMEESKSKGNRCRATGNRATAMRDQKLQGKEQNSKEQKAEHKTGNSLRFDNRPKKCESLCVVSLCVCMCGWTVLSTQHKARGKKQETRSTKQYIVLSPCPCCPLFPPACRTGCKGAILAPDADGPQNSAVFFTDTFSR